VPSPYPSITGHRQSPKKEKKTIFVSQSWKIPALLKNVEELAKTFLETPASLATGRVRKKEKKIAQS
jgi:hypothetical protein